MRLDETTNGKLTEVLIEVHTLIGWAEADAEQSLDDGAPDQARNDKARATKLRKVLKLLSECER